MGAKKVFLSIDWKEDPSKEERTRKRNKSMMWDPERKVVFAKEKEENSYQGLWGIKIISANITEHELDNLALR
jgi:hypothetical protein